MTVPWAASPERHRLAEAMRRFVDVVPRTGADAHTLETAAAALESATARLAAPTFRRTLDITRDSHRREMSLVNGGSHPLALQVEMRELEDGYEGTVTVGPAWEGGPGLVHGGAITLLFDHVMAWATTKVGRPGPSMTATMSLLYRTPTPLGEPLVITARVARVSGRKIEITAALRVAGQLSVEGAGLFIKLTEEHYERVYRLSS